MFTRLECEPCYLWMNILTECVFFLSSCISVYLSWSVWRHPQKTCTPEGYGVWQMRPHGESIQLVKLFGRCTWRASACVFSCMCIYPVFLSVCVFVLFVCLSCLCDCSFTHLFQHSDMAEEMRTEAMELCVTACEKFANSNEVRQVLHGSN